MSTDRKVPPPRRPAVSGGAASRPPVAGARPPAPAPARPAPARPLPAAEELEDDAKTQAFNIADMGLDDHGDDEKTSAFNINDLPPEDPAPQARQPQRTLVGHPVSPTARPAPVRSAPVRSNTAPGRPAPAAPAAAPAADEATMAMNVDAMLAAMDDDGDEKTSAMSVDEIAQIEASRKAREAAKPAAAARPLPASETIDSNDKTQAFNVDEAMAVINQAQPPARAAAQPAASRAVAPRAQAAPAANAGGYEVPAKDGFFGSIQYFFAYHGIKKRADRGELPKSAVDGDAARKGLINTAIIGGGVLVLTLIAGLLK